MVVLCHCDQLNEMSSRITFPSFPFLSSLYSVVHFVHFEACLKMKMKLFVPTMEARLIAFYLPMYYELRDQRCECLSDCDSPE